MPETSIDAVTLFPGRETWGYPMPEAGLPNANPYDEDPYDPDPYGRY